MQENIIVWQKWVDPFGLDEDLDDSIDSMEDEFTSDEPDEEEIESESEQDTNQIYSHLKKIKPHIRVMATPMGIIPITENTSSGKIFNFWTGHTNFNITKKLAYTIENIDGVETLDVFTRYRFRISVGKAFNDSDVMRNINNIIYRKLENVK